MKSQEARLAAVNHHPDYPPPAFIDEMYLKEVEATRLEAEEIIEIMNDSGEDVPAPVVELVYRGIPAMAGEIRHLRWLLGWD